MQEDEIRAVDATLGSVLVILNKAIRRAEQLQDQTLAEDLHEIYWSMRDVYSALPARGRRYKRPPRLAQVLEQVAGDHAVDGAV